MTNLPKQRTFSPGDHLIAYGPDSTEDILRICYDPEDDRIFLLDEQSHVWCTVSPPCPDPNQIQAETIVKAIQDAEPDCFYMVAPYTQGDLS